MHVDFTVADRCDTNCWSGSNPVPASWPDVPWDQSCTTTPCNDLSPAFYTAKRLAQVTTKVWNPAKTPSPGYDNVEQWTLHHSYPSPGDGTRAGLFLDRISHVGLVGMTTSVPDVTFEGQAMPNRVMPDTGDGKPGMNWERVKSITTEAGGVISVAYAPANCSSTSLPDVNNLQDNHLRCFPVHWTNPATGTTSLEFFHKYVVSSVAESDPTGGSTHSLTSYDYVGNAAWHYTDDDGLIQPTDKTWSVWRGYPTVRTTKGDPGDPNVVRTQTETTYFQGMHGDHLPSGTRSVVMPAIDMNGDGDTADQADVPASNDEDVFAGLVRRSTTLNGVSGVEVSSTASQPWRSNPTASRTINGVTVEARYVHAAASFNRVALDTDSGHRVAGWRTTSSVTAFDSLGMPLSTEDRGDDAVTGDETCHLVEYVRDATVLGATAPDANKWLMAYPKRSRDFATTCATATSPTAQLTADDIVADNLNLYDGLALGAPPTKGDMTEARALKSWDAATQTPGYLTVSMATYDAYGRMTGATDVRGNQTTTAYTPATGGPVTGSSVTNSLGWTVTTVLNPAWGASLSSTDANGHITNQAYDGLGRLTSVWDPSRSTSQPATTVYTYNLRNDAVSSVTTQALTPAGTYLSTYQLYDALLRPRQTQAADINGGGRIVSDFFYDSLGRPYLTSEPHLEPGSPGTALFVPDPGSELDVASQTKTLFDGAGRATAGISLSNGDELWRTTSSYTGDREDVTPPHGGTASSEITDAQGRVVELRQYANPTPTGTSTSTRYTYNRKGQLVAVQDPAGHQWTTTYDLLGRAIAATDPDKGATSSTYNDVGDRLTSTDALGNILAYTYDSHRPTHDRSRRLGHRAQAHRGRLRRTHQRPGPAHQDDPVRRHGRVQHAGHWVQPELPADRDQLHHPDHDQVPGYRRHVRLQLDLQPGRIPGHAASARCGRCRRDAAGAADLRVQRIRRPDDPGHQPGQHHLRDRHHVHVVRGDRPDHAAEQRRPVRLRPVRLRVRHPAAERDQGLPRHRADGGHRCQLQVRRRRQHHEDQGRRGRTDRRHPVPALRQLPAADHRLDPGRRRLCHRPHGRRAGWTGPLLDVVAVRRVRQPDPAGRARHPDRGPDHQLQLPDRRRRGLPPARWNVHGGQQWDDDGRLRVRRARQHPQPARHRVVQPDA